MSERTVEIPRVPVILASASPRRRDLLELLGISFSIQIADVDETPLPGEGPEALSTRLARAKALTISRRSSPANPSSTFPDMSQPRVETGSDDFTALQRSHHVVSAESVVLAADTVVALGDAMLGKPADEAEAIGMLNALRGQAHRVLTGMALAVKGEIVQTSVAETIVWMRAYGDDEIGRYVRSGIPFDRAGAYGIQDVEFRPVERIEGCYTNVVGLPLCEVRAALTALDLSQQFGVLAEGDICQLLQRSSGTSSSP